MKNLHQINPFSDIPDWVKKLLVAYFDMNGSLKRTWIYAPSHDALSFDRFYSSETKRTWESRGWKSYMDNADISRFPPIKNLEIIIIDA